jgi:hypothetical protein
VLAHLATGGMAEIYLARVTGLHGFERHVVLKCIRPEHATSASSPCSSTRRACRAQLRHTNIAQVHDIGEGCSRCCGGRACAS